MRIAVIDKELCTPKKCCHECMKYCPINRKGEECVKVDSTAIIEEPLCIGCGICTKKCPFAAISIVNLPEALKETPVHRFGKNAFVLFRLPIPVKGVVGLLGANGIGKTTALKILAGKLKPNMAKEAGIEELIRMNRGTELQDYLEKLANKEITTVYKPQQVNTLPKEIKKTVRELVDQSLIKELELETCKEKRLYELSGGELQRVAIAAAVSKDADIYYFDEPSSFLDVRQRMNMAKLIRKLAEEKYVMVVEHDLATLDILADRIHIFYGSPAVYGIVSKPYVVRKGINAFLSGYIAEDNVRIRDPTIFETANQGKKGNEILTSFNNITKKYDKFKLEIKQGEIIKDEVLGIFGANALGKTTFAKILAGELEFSGDIAKKIKISYKPQYLDNEFTGTVTELLDTEKNTGTTEFRALVARPFELERLMNKKLSNLSGGELQRVAVALCLARDCDLYLLDEPSAYLDVDQRLALAKILRNRTAMVIDHDLLFLSYVADRAMLFTGSSGEYGSAECMLLRQGLNTFLKEVDITFRRDPETKRPRANKPGSLKDREQKEKGEYFY
ncbi:MAG: ribosome biogenesis/translation initiation ATPase RLI [Candidatus Aenigmarchaeota archaeon]|nr:ribosome biogenesis/translation initiation ATPase RLI [Candidatus Aenigmarchaeota archaeon]